LTPDITDHPTMVNSRQTSSTTATITAASFCARGRQGGRSHSIKRRSPHGPIRDLGELFIESAGSEAINRDIPVGDGTGSASDSDNRGRVFTIQQRGW
jgi:hypothetical protein